MNPLINAIDFNERPFIAIWEMTQACRTVFEDSHNPARTTRGMIAT
jgi:hypothetical protein